MNRLVTGGNLAQASLVVRPVGAPHGAVPRACLEQCLGQRAEDLSQRGCPWLKAVVQGRIDPRMLQGGRCQRGNVAEAMFAKVDGVASVVLTVHPDAVVDGRAASLDRVRDLLRENESLAEEVLRGYEQLNFVLEINRELINLERVEEVQACVVQHLETILRTPVRGARIDDPSLGEELVALGQQARTEGRALVLPRDDSTVLVGVLPGREANGRLVLAERPLNDPFNAADVRLLESLLEYAGEVADNLALQRRLSELARESTRALIAAIEKKDRYTFGHSERVGFLSRVLGDRLGIAEAELMELEWAGLLHDVGKIGVPEAILNKPGKLTDAEFDEIKKHPVMGYEILRPVQAFRHLLDGVLYHHECPDGSGYPRGLRGEAIPQFARIIHVADVFDALSSARSYRSEFTAQRALDIIRKETGTKLDPTLSAMLIEYVEEQIAAPSADFQTQFAHLLNCETPEEAAVSK